MKFLKVICAVMALLSILSLSACGGKKGDNTETESSNVSTVSKQIYLSNTTVGEISQKIGALPPQGALALSLSRDNLSAPKASFKYDVSLDNKTVATVSAASDSENKASLFTIRWGYSEYTADVNNDLLLLSVELLKCAWPECNEESLKSLDMNFHLTTEYIDKIIDYNLVETANAENGGFISLGVNSGNVIITVSYPNIVE